MTRPDAPDAKPPFRADHVGSLLRPQRLHQARQDRSDGEITAAELQQIEDEAIAEVVRAQQQAGLRSATDGEFRRAYWHQDFILQLEGIEPGEGTTTVQFQNADGVVEWKPAGMKITDKVRLGEPIFLDAFNYLKSVAGEGITPKLTIPSPSMVHYRGGSTALDPQIYPDVEEFWSDLSAAYADEVNALTGAGCRYLQLDDTSLAYLNDEKQRAAIAARGEDAEHQHLRYIKQINAALADRPADLSVTTHLCRGNYRSSWVAEGGYDFVAEALFGELDVDGFFLEFDDERSGGFEPLRFVPKGKRVVLGLVTTKRGELESKDRLKRRIEEATEYIDLDQLCLSPQCGFSSTVEGNALTHDDQMAKLDLVVETAAEVWG
ncbi:5-methyltetrahydropteroyltriglutamate--homocysteine S-methyltransferase [Saccharopolyspora halophila]|uniref:5-methyltetrahydropteroyltriglutamate-- homocysteine S-methyltransferase n=1 Tax=Saccharopolyspora halophila TaxID=405551 RepID=UPI0031D3F63E